MKKRLLSIMAVLCMVFVMIPAGVYADDTCPKGGEHSYVYTTNNDGTHTVTCKNGCELSRIENCSGGTASTDSRAVCDKCKTAYGYYLNSPFRFELKCYNDEAAVTDAKVVCDDSTSEQLKWAGDEYDKGFFISTEADTLQEANSTKIKADSETTFKEDTDYYLVVKMVAGENRTLANTQQSDIDGTVCETEDGYGYYIENPKAILHDGESDTYYAVFKLPQLISYTIPITKVVKVDGNTQPGKTEFKFEANLMEQTEDVEKGNANQTYEGTVTTNGKGSYEGGIVVSGIDGDLQNRMFGGFVVKEVSGEDKDWKYSDKVYVMFPEETTDPVIPARSSNVTHTVSGASSDVTAAKAGELKWDIFIAEEQTEDDYTYYNYKEDDPQEKAVFTNTYTKVTKAAAGTDDADKPEKTAKAEKSEKTSGESAKTGDDSSMAPWLAILALSGAAAAGTLVVRRRNYNR